MSEEKPRCWNCKDTGEVEDHMLGCRYTGRPYLHASECSMGCGGGSVPCPICQTWEWVPLEDMRRRLEDVARDLSLCKQSGRWMDTGKEILEVLEEFAHRRKGEHDE